MFYNITRHLTKSLINLFILVIGFGFGFFIMHRNTRNDNFENPMKSIVKVSSIEKETIGLISENYYNIKNRTHVKN